MDKKHLYRATDEIMFVDTCLNIDSTVVCLI